jgi:hypothetical protein
MQSSKYLITFFRTNAICSKLILRKILCFFLLNDFVRTIRIITEAFPLVLVILRFELKYFAHGASCICEGR